MPNTYWSHSKMKACLFWAGKHLTGARRIAFQKSGKKRPRYFVAWA